MSFVLGMNAKMYYLPVADGPRVAWASQNKTLLEEMTLVQNVNLSIDVATTDVTTRGGNGWRQTAATLRDATVNFDVLWDNSQAAEPGLGLAALANAAMTSTTLAFAVLDGIAEPQIADSDPTTRGLWADFIVSSFPQDQALESALTISVSIQPTYTTVAPEWVSQAPT